MAKKPPKRPTDPISLAKVIGDIATGQGDKPSDPTQDELRRVMSMLGKKGGPKGGAARSKALSKTRRKEIAKEAAKTRWAKRKA